MLYVILKVTLLLCVFIGITVAYYKVLLREVFNSIKKS